jgi:hypothetical protein
MPFLSAMKNGPLIEHHPLDVIGELKMSYKVTMKESNPWMTAASDRD